MNYTDAISATRRTLFPFLPSAIRRRAAERRAPEMTKSLKSLRYKAIREVEFHDKYLSQLELSEGPVLLGLPASTQLETLFGPTLESIGIAARHTGVCLDWVTRFEHPHMAIAFDRLTGPKEARAYFHPQHLNLAQECETFSSTLRSQLAQEFMPKDGWTVLDVGAYLGHGGLWMATRVGRRGRVVSVEAIEENFLIVQKHRALNPDLAWKAVRAAIWEKSGDVLACQRSEFQANALDSEVISAHHEEAVRTTSIPALTEMCGGHVDLLSLTVNGAEVEAIRGMAAMEKSTMPQRILVPGWYLKNNAPRAHLIEPMLKAYGYSIALTPGNFIYAWRG